MHRATSPSWSTRPAQPPPTRSSGSAPAILATDLASASLKVDVVKQASKTTLASSAKTILLGKTVKLSGKVSPATTGNAKIQYRRTTSGTWKTAVNTFALNASSGYSKTYRPSAKGTWYFRTLYAGKHDRGELYIADGQGDGEVGSESTLGRPALAAG